MQTVGICGYSGTGSSAVVDLLKEYPQNQVIDRCEFILPYEPDGLMDLSYHLNEGSSKFSSSNTAIYRFRKAIRGGQFRYIRELTGGKLVDYSEEYLDRIVQCTWIGSEPPNLCNQPFRDLTRRVISKFRLGKPFYNLEKRAGCDLNIFPMGRMYFSSHPDGFYEATRDFTNKVINSITKINYSKNIVLDQPYPGNNPTACFPFFENPKAIVVDRDPRDLYLLTKEFWFESQAWRPLPTNTVDSFIKYYRNLRKSKPAHEDRDVLRIKFEDLVYKYEETRSIIEQFLGLDCNRNIKTHFNPDKSVNNTQLYNSYSNYHDDIKRIEAELTDYLFPFQEYGNKVFNRNAMFE